MLGNLKFAALEQPQPTFDDAIGRPYWLAASTHDDEELQLCRLISTLPRSHLLVIAPRHPQRSAKIQQQLAALAVPFAVRSANQPLDEHTQVYLADTLGEMPQWLQNATAVFMGGSLVPVGGHNVLEAASAAAPVVTGPHMSNFKEEVALLRPSGAVVVENDAAAVIARIAELLNAPETAREKGLAGQAAVALQRGVLQRYTEALAPLIAGD